MGSIDSVIAALENNPSIIIPLVREVPVSVLKRRPAPNAWSAHEIACHLAAAQPMSFERLDLMLRENNPVIKPYLPNVDDAPDTLLQMDLDEALDRFIHDRIRLVERIKGLTPDEWQRPRDMESIRTTPCSSCSATWPCTT